MRSDISRPPKRSTTIDDVKDPLVAKAGGIGPERRWPNGLDRRPRELPIARPTIALALHALRDEIVLLGLRARRPVSDELAFDRINLEAVAALDFYGRRGWLDNTEGFFAPPPPLTDVTVRQVRSRRRRHERIAFDSGYAPYAGEPGTQRWLGYTANNREYALMLRHKEPRPWLVCIHGAEMGRAALDLTLFRAWHLHVWCLSMPARGSPPLPSRRPKLIHRSMLEGNHRVGSRGSGVSMLLLALTGLSLTELEAAMCLLP